MEDGSEKRLIDAVINEVKIDDLFRDYYRHRDNSILQLVFLSLSKAKMTSGENIPNLKDDTDEDAQIERRKSMFT